jgi:hypothetical protein
VRRNEIKTCRDHGGCARRSEGLAAPITSLASLQAIRKMDPSVIVEVLVPDFHAQEWCIQIVLDAGPDFTITIWKR